MALWDFEQIAGVLGSLGIAEAADESLHTAALATERGGGARAIGEIVAVLKAQGLVLLPAEEPDRPPILPFKGVVRTGHPLDPGTPDGQT
jgi:hypothetical protein